MHIKGKVAIVTGGAGGLGQAIVRALLEKEAKVCIFDIHADRGAEIESSLQGQFGGDKVSFSLCDVTDEKGFKEAFDGVVARHGQVDIMINNAAIVTEKIDIDKMLMVNLGGTIRGSNLAIKHMRKDEGGKGGVVVNVSSVAAIESFHTIPAYTATKSGVVGFTRSWAANPYLKEMDLRFCLVCPTAFESFILPAQMKQALYVEDVMKFIEKLGSEEVDQTSIEKLSRQTIVICKNPNLRRFTTRVSRADNLIPKDIAASVIDLLEEDDSNGTIIHTRSKGQNRRVKIEVTDEST